MTFAVTLRSAPLFADLAASGCRALLADDTIAIATIDLLASGVTDALTRKRDACGHAPYERTRRLPREYARRRSKYRVMTPPEFLARLGR